MVTIFSSWVDDCTRTEGERCVGCDPFTDNRGISTCGRDYLAHESPYLTLDINWVQDSSSILNRADNMQGGEPQLGISFAQHCMTKVQPPRCLIPPESVTKVMGSIKDQ